MISYVVIVSEEDGRQECTLFREVESHHLNVQLPTLLG